MPGLTGRNPDEVFGKFTTHLARLLNRTITDAPLSYLMVSEKENRAYISFRHHDAQVAAPLFSHDLFLFLGQVVTVIQEGESWRLKTLQYRYWIQGDDNANTDSWFFRFEYISPKMRPMMNPRHHMHLPCTLRCGQNDIELRQLHIPTGWVTVEEIVRFLVNEVGVRCKARTWDKILLQSEELFREWTTRTVP
jgi:hypothetical protein